MDVIELFAGVGGFRIGLDRVNEHVHEAFFQTIWSNQFEPSTVTQHASRTYIRAFGAEGHVNQDIALVPTNQIPNHDLLVGGFPCQDYSVARTLKQSQGILGKKGVLWWQIERIIREKGDNAPSVLFLENVDRLVQSPAKQRGRDFAMILQSLSDLGYIVEWRIVTASEYGFPQRRKRTYILAYRNNSVIANQVQDPTEWIYNDGVFAHAFPIHDFEGDMPLQANALQAEGDETLADLSENFNRNNHDKPFCNAGIMINGHYWTNKVLPNYQGEYQTLGDILLQGEEHEQIAEEFYIDDAALEQWRYLKGGKHIERVSADGHAYMYSEGSMAFPDYLDRPSRTIITSEGGQTPSRFKHIILDPINNRYRRLTPIELERLDMFPDNHTFGETDTKRAFFMGNALVCGIVTNVGQELFNRLHHNG